MFEPQEIRSEHKDVIHDVLYDYYGQRIATCSSDQTVKVRHIYYNFPASVSIKTETISFFYIVHRFGIKTIKVNGRCRQVGKRILARCGVYRGRIQSLALFWPHVRLTEQFRCGKRRSARSQRRP